MGMFKNLDMATPEPPPIGSRSSSNPTFNGIKRLIAKLKKAVGDGHGRMLCQRSCPPADVPRGFLAMYAGREHKRFVIPAVYLNHPAFRLLLDKAREEYGFSQKGVLNMPFELLLFERILWLVGHGEPAPYELGIEELEQYYREKHYILMETIPVDDDDDDGC